MGESQPLFFSWLFCFGWLLARRSRLDITRMMLNHSSRGLWKILKQIKTANLLFGLRGSFTCCLNGDGSHPLLNLNISSVQFGECPTSLCDFRRKRVRCGTGWCGTVFGFGIFHQTG
jgi:hypothetical protein